MSRVAKTCNVCGKDFEVKKCRENVAKYCSYRCMGYGNEPNRLKANEANRGKKYTKERNDKISKFMLGNKYGLKGYSVSSGGYILIYSPKHPNKNKSNYVPKHRLVAEEHLGRFLNRTEQVHHINLDVSDNRPENLFVFENGSEHIVFHKLIKYNDFLLTWLKSNIII